MRDAHYNAKDKRRMPYNPHVGWSASGIIAGEAGAIKRIYTAYNEREKERAKQEHREPILIRHFSVHNLRHTFCTRFCENETNIKVIQEIMGHSDISTTMNIYAEATESKKKESFENLQGKVKICWPDKENRSGMPGRFSYISNLSQFFSQFKEWW